MGATGHYFRGIQEGIRSSLHGLQLTWRHLWSARHRTNQVSIQSTDYFAQHQGIVTLEYPYEAIPVPENGRYRLHNEIDDCIVCDKCAKVCPVDCIEIEAIKSTEEIGVTSDGTSKRLYAATFDIDMAKCCYCGLCTTVCPTECLTMTPTFDYSEFDIRDMNYHFTDLGPEEAEEKQRLYDQKQAEKAAAKLAATPQSTISTKPLETEASDQATDIHKPKPSFKPKFASPKDSESNEPISLKDNVTPAETGQPAHEIENKPKPVFRPKMPIAKPSTEQSLPLDSPDQTDSTSLAPNTENDAAPENKPKPIFRPKMPVKKGDSNTSTPQETSETNEIQESGSIPLPEATTPSPSKPVFKPKIPFKKPLTEEYPKQEIPKVGEQKEEKPEEQPSIVEKAVENQADSEKPSAKPKPVFKPKMKPTAPPKQSDEEPQDEN